MKCPKCGHEQASDIECDRCGVIFEKFLRIQAQRHQAESSPNVGAPHTSPDSKQTPRLHLILGLFIAMGLCFGGYWYGLNKAGKLESAQNDAPLDEASSPAAMSDDAEVAEESGVAGQLYKFKAPKNNIEKGQIATVFIQTPWGLGSGFFIDKECWIFTNKHVVQFDDDQIAELEGQIAMLEDIISKEKNDIKELKHMRFDIDNSRHFDEIDEAINQRRQNMETHEGQLEQLSDLLDDVRQGADSVGVSVLLLDDSEHSIESVLLSERHDIALLKLDLENCPSLSPSFASLEIGQRVYTIGNPLGLSHTVTSGIVSGRRVHEDIHFIQTDAPINRGNSGGPLIDEEGRVVGINTFIFKDSEGIGFALPIEFAMKEFDLLE